MVVRGCVAENYCVFFSRFRHKHLIPLGRHNHRRVRPLLLPPGAARHNPVLLGRYPRHLRGIADSSEPCHDSHEIWIFGARFPGGGGCALSIATEFGFSPLLRSSCRREANRSTLKLATRASFDQLPREQIFLSPYLFRGIADAPEPCHIGHVRVGAQDVTGGCAFSRSHSFDDKSLHST